MNATSHFFQRLLFILAIGSLASCGGGGGGGGTPQSISLSAVGSTPGEVALNWSGGPAGVTGYDLYRNGVAVFPTHLTGTSVTDTALSAGTRYCYRVYAVSFPTGIVAQSNEACTTTASYASGWNPATVATGGMHDFALASTGVGHVSFRRSGNLRYASTTTGAWAEEVVDASAGAYGDTAITLDALNVPHIAYGNTSTGGVYYARKTGGMWTRELVNTTGGYVSALVVDAAGKAHIVYSEGYPSYSIWYATNAGGIWTKAFLAGYGNNIQSAAIRMDNGGALHIAYAVGDGICTLVHVRYAGGTGTGSVVAENTGCRVSLALDGAQNPHVAYRKNLQIMHATQFLGTWSTSVVDTLSWIGGDYVSIATDAGDRLYVSFGDRNGDLKYGTNATGSWRFSYIDKVVSRSVVRIGPDGRANIVYDADSAGTLRFARSP